jgi:diaminohydroxyphosphoribosylaminopyrimidine deaminase / 5-amino-6-(5-phosphoribosylamino)uracil reductase
MIEKLMKKAILLAKKSKNKTLPNPRVGAIIFDSKGNVVSKGYHKAFGKDHAEVNAINGLKNKKTKNLSMCVTLEPCNHFGKTPPCTKAILNAGIKNIYIGAKDDCKSVCGKGCNFLKKNGINVKKGILEKECRSLNPGFHKFNKTGLAYVSLKLSIGLNYGIGSRSWFTSEKAKKEVHKIRSNSDLIITSYKTVKNDNPNYTVRLNNKEKLSNVLIIDNDLKLFSKYLENNLNVLKNKKILIATSTKDKEKIKILKEIGFKILKFRKNKEYRINLKTLIKKVSKDYKEIMLEAGPALFNEFLKLGPKYVDKIFLFTENKNVKGKKLIKTKNFKKIKASKIEKLGSTLMLEGSF